MLRPFVKNESMGRLTRKTGTHPIFPIPHLILRSKHAPLPVIRGNRQDSLQDYRCNPQGGWYNLYEAVALWAKG
jgi:hypothetical protein